MTREKIHAVAEDPDVTETQVPNSCGMECKKYCFTDRVARFENKPETYYVCLVPTCDCTTKKVDYKIEKKEPK